ncbi:hypothetical protein TBR22_A15270 [Luteitalea sp. TBR-22]|uniref:hypothetical protein n=1 Tax=Luteitalea sp. TBR-22 TaxID=2802971 RepID=UPI001AF6E917|nr:hypothetical protein [Luteitalea sp. TBR-22]BCS32317.1 hypothetical protein TBR22_A15270 [Luteitalea sp. TBR-22]
MSIWANERLVVFGAPTDLRAFSREAGPASGRIDTDRSRVFLPSMEHGEGGDLFSDRTERLTPDLSRKRYHWQSSTDDEGPMVKRVARRHPRLAFILIDSCVDVDLQGGGLYRARHAPERWDVPAEVREALMWRRYDEFGVLADQSGAKKAAALYESENQAFIDMMDLVEFHFTPAAMDWVRSRSR